MRKTITTVIIAIITIIILLSFIDRTPMEEVNNTADIVYSINNIPKNLKSIGDLDKRQQDIICATSKGLIEVDVNGEIKPSLAESVDVNDDGLEYVFTIRKDVYWSDGTNITADDIVTFFREVITEENEISALLNVFGVSEYINSNKSFGETVAITSEDDKVRIRLNSKDSNFLQELSKPQYRVRKSLLFWEDLTVNYDNIVYSGDYSITSINDEEVLLTRCKKSSIQLAQTIHLVRDENEELALASFEIGNRDIVVNPPTSQLERLKNEGKLVTIPSNEAIYLAFNLNNYNFSNEVKNQIYKNINDAMVEYEQENNILLDLAECSYFRDDKDDLTKLQSRNVSVNVSTDVEMPSRIVLVAKEGLQNKDLTNYLINWFNENTEMTLVVNLLPEDEMNLIGEKNYYDVALVDVYAKIDDEEVLFKTISSFIPSSFREMILNSTTKTEKEELFVTIEEEIFNNYRILPLVFYNDTIAVSTDVKDNILDGNGNIDFRSIKK